MDEETIKSQTWKLLEKDPLLKPKHLCSLLHLNYKKYHQYIKNLRSLWKSNTKNEQASKRLSFHNWHGWVYVPKGCSRVDALSIGWLQTASRNHFLLWKDRCGRLEWHLSGRIKVYVRKPASVGKAFQLLANAFHQTALVPDIRVFHAFAKNLRLKGAHATVELGMRMPYVCIDFLEESNGVTFKLGDISHPTQAEIQFHYPDYAEKCELAMTRFVETLERLTSPEKPKPLETDSSYRV